MDRPKNLILIRALCVCRRLGPAYFLGKNFNFRTHVSTCGAKNMPKIVPFKFSLKFSCCWPFEALQKKIAHRYFIFSRELQNGRPPNPLKPNNCLQILDKTWFFHSTKSHIFMEIKTILILPLPLRPLSRGDKICAILFLQEFHRWVSPSCN